MSKKYFGTDGIRTKANTGALTAEKVLRIGQAVGQLFKKESQHTKPTVLIGKDTRLSGYMFEAALEAGFTSVGFNVTLVGPMPTPAVAMLTNSMRADLGVMISASHNPYQDNGIKIFTADGFKLTEEQEQEIERLIDAPESIELVTEAHIGRAIRIDDAAGRYIEFVKHSVDASLNLEGLKIVLDSANGAAYKVAPQTIWELGAEIISIADEPNGTNINAHCGSTHIEKLQEVVRQTGADIGIALDGDADRVILCDENGQEIDGDQVMAAIAVDWHQQGRLKGSAIAATQMSNMGLEKYLESNGLSLKRTAVGDKYVMQEMRQKGLNFGGEQSGHMIFLDYGTTGDGLIAALQFLSIMQRKKIKASELGSSFKPFPQKLENIRLPEGVDAQQILDEAVVKQSIKKSQDELLGKGRVFIRKSGTEPLIRVMVEAEEDADMTQHINILTAQIKQTAAQ